MDAGGPFVICFCISANAVNHFGCVGLAIAVAVFFPFFLFFRLQQGQRAVVFGNLALGS